MYHILFNSNPSPEFFSEHALHDLSQALIDLIVAVDWKSFTIIYENNDSLMQIMNILKSPPTNNPIRIRQLSQGPNFRYAQWTVSFIWKW